MAALLAFLIVLAILIVLISIVRNMIRFILTYFFSPLTFQRGLRPEHSEILEQHFPYYHKLLPRQKKAFQKRMRYFVLSKEFIPRNMPEVTEEMKIMISACAVQLTFGLPPLRLRFFHHIIVYPDRYTSQSGKQHKGEVNTRLHAIVLSWKDFLQGYLVSDDSYNVGLHEFAHALKVEDAIRNDEFDFFNTKHIVQLHREFQRLQHILSAGSHTLIRPYAGTNFDEFFAVCVEYFFEKPVELQQHESTIFSILKNMLRQNPLLMR